MLKIFSWNIAHRADLWRTLLDSEADVALLQEACEPPSDIASRFDVDIEPWRTEGAGIKRPWRTVVVGLSSRIRLQRMPPRAICDAGPDDLAVTLLGTVACVHVEDPDSREIQTLISMYAP